MDRIADSEKNETDKRIEQLEKKVTLLTDQLKTNKFWLGIYIAMLPLVVIVLSYSISGLRTRLDEKDSEIKTLVSSQVESEAELRLLRNSVVDTLNIHEAALRAYGNALQTHTEALQFLNPAWK